MSDTVDPAERVYPLDCISAHCGKTECPGGINNE